ncbi:MarR family transcriptional regulator [Acidovorax carolinensis]|uniref:MarR family transcriptional regulator n=1 Tax=Acidovorax carolinensis TaxID=553814 RepID=A0A240UAY9_9BURK|nr:MarR family transcriptional regulator [Acidovorax carolinensis]ART55870.1 MarR family transcriptional regulator [Acidovorax carolinensis]ART58233.1 MarR family transcriptional regulator [Acidovorax carolinensis]
MDRPARSAATQDAPAEAAAPVGAVDPFEVPLNRSFTYRFHQLSKLSDPVSHQAYLEEAGLSLSDGRCLTTIGTFEPMSVKDLARLSNLNKSQASRAAQALVDQGLVLKQGSEADGRGVVLMLSPEGRARWQAANQLVVRRNREIFGCLSPRELAQLGKLLDRLVAHNERS